MVRPFWFLLKLLAFNQPQQMPESPSWDIWKEKYLYISSLRGCRREVLTEPLESLPIVLGGPLENPFLCLTFPCTQLLPWPFFPFHLSSSRIGVHRHGRSTLPHFRANKPITSQGLWFLLWRKCLGRASFQLCSSCCSCRAVSNLPLSKVCP